MSTSKTKSKHLRCGSPAVPAEDRGGRRKCYEEDFLIQLQMTAKSIVGKIKVPEQRVADSQMSDESVIDAQHVDVDDSK
jgi:hypothetical protein